MDRNNLKAWLYLQRGRCDICGRWLPTGCQMHESIVRKGHAMGWPKEQRGLINAEENCHLVCSELCHRKAHANPPLMVAIQIVRYGTGRIQRWIDSLPFKVEYDWDRGIDEEEAADFVWAHEGSRWILREDQ